MAFKTIAVILAGGEGSRLGVLTFKRTKPAVPFAGKYRIIDFTLSNCVNSGIFDVMILAQYRPHSLIEHIGAGGPWDLNRDFTGGVRIYTPYKGRGGSDWYLGTADAVQQNFRFVKKNNPEYVLILSGDHIYTMNYDTMIQFHLSNKADVTMATIRVPFDEISRFGIVETNRDYQVTSFVEKPTSSSSNLANMGVYLFNIGILDKMLWDDHTREHTNHDFGKNILPRMVESKLRVFAYPYSGYWMDVGTIESYWSAHMDLLAKEPPIDLNDRSWIIHTRTEERPPVRFMRGATIIDSMIADGCLISPGAWIERSVLSPGVVVKEGAYVFESIILTDTTIDKDAIIEHAIIDKRVTIGKDVKVGMKSSSTSNHFLTMLGKNSILPDGILVETGAVIGTDVTPKEFHSMIVKEDEYIENTRSPHEA
jgi:glucose-1-phosphate adenylyltransferase